MKHHGHLRLIVCSDRQAKSERFDRYREAKQQWDRTRDERDRREAFAALRQYSPVVAARYGDGKLWGFN